VQIIGVGFGTPSTQQSWKEQEGFQYEIWSDSDKTLAVYYGAASGKTALFPTRVTKVLDAGGNLILEYLSVSPSGHPQDVLSDCQQIFGN